MKRLTKPQERELLAWQSVTWRPTPRMNRMHSQLIAAGMLTGMSKTSDKGREYLAEHGDRIRRENAKP